MRGSIDGTSAEGWLRRVGVPETEVTTILNSFGSPPRVCRFVAPHVFLRFHGVSSRRRIDQPNYWADGDVMVRAFMRASQFEGFLTDAEIRGIARTYYRDLAAISHNWNDLASSNLWRIRLQDSETVDGLAGPVAPQPTHQAKQSGSRFHVNAQGWWYSSVPESGLTLSSAHPSTGKTSDSLHTPETPRLSQVGSRGDSLRGPPAVVGPSSSRARLRPAGILVRASWWVSQSCS